MSTPILLSKITEYKYNFIAISFYDDLSLYSQKTFLPLYYSNTWTISYWALFVFHTFVDVLKCFRTIFWDKPNTWKRSSYMWFISHVFHNGLFFSYSALNQQKYLIQIVMYLIHVLPVLEWIREWVYLFWKKCST